MKPAKIQLKLGKKQFIKLEIESKNIMLLRKLSKPIIYANIAISQMLSQCMIFALQGAKNEI